MKGVWIIIFLCLVPLASAMAPAQEVIASSTPFSTEQGDIYLYTSPTTINVGEQVIIGVVFVYGEGISATITLEGTDDVIIPEIIGGDVDEVRSFVQQEWVVSPMKSTTYTVDVSESEKTILRREVKTTIGDVITEEYQDKEQQIRKEDFSPTYEERTLARDVIAIERYFERKTFEKRYEWTQDKVILGKTSTVKNTIFSSGAQMITTTFGVEVQQDHPEELFIVELFDAKGWDALDKEGSFTVDEGHRAIYWRTSEQFFTPTYSLLGQQVPVAKTVVISLEEPKRINPLALLLLGLLAAGIIVMIVAMLLKQKS